MTWTMQMLYADKVAGMMCPTSVLLDRRARALAGAALLVVRFVLKRGMLMEGLMRLRMMLWLL